MENSDKILWRSDYDTGIQEIDEQHRILVNTINEAGKKLSKDSSIEALQDITKDLLSYALYHFETEEEMMKKYNYKVYNQEECETHMQQHRDFSAQIVTIRESIKTAKPMRKEELIEFLTNWLINHINNIDKKLATFLKIKQRS